jgi:hypothetical protein
MSCSKTIQIGLNTEFSLLKEEKVVSIVVPSSFFISGLQKDCYQNKIIENKKSNIILTFLFCSNEIKSDYLSNGYKKEFFKMTNSQDTVICHKKIKDLTSEFIFQEPGFTHYIIINVSNNSEFDADDFLKKRLRSKYFVSAN